MRLLLCLLLLMTVKSLRSFNVDTGKTWITPHTASLLWPTVLQHSDGNTTMILATSSVDKGLGRLRKCTVLQEEIQCQEIALRGKIKGSKNIQDGGIAVDRNSDWILACLQKKHRRGFSATEDMNGICTLLTSDLRSSAFLNLTKMVETKLNDIQSKTSKDEIANTSSACGELFDSPGNNHMCRAENIPSEAPEHRNTNVHGDSKLPSWLEEDQEEEEEKGLPSGREIAFILDGSGSIEPEDFERAKAFIHKMMKTLYEKCFECSFAVVQYGFEIRTEFDLRENWDPRATLQKVLDIVQVCNVTKTASAMQHVLDSIFTESHGSRKDAAKVMIVLTDGEILLDEMNLTTVINSPKMAGIERYAIGVGDAFKKPKALKELRLIASGPDDTNVFQVTNYSALEGLLSTLQQSIIGIEGLQGDALQYELAQAGFNVQVLDKQVLMFGAVGAFDWSGGILLYDLATKTAVFLNESKEAAEKAKYSYLGYSVAVARMEYGPLYVAGAPRHSMTGKVLVFQDGRLKQTLQGEQVGSYFGSELCPLDVNHDGVTDLLLVGAPFYHVRGEEGRVYVYRLETETGLFTFKEHLNVQVTSPFARFGFSVASIGDVDGDGYEDIAVGAPLEDQLSNSSSFGSIYIFNGDKDKIESSFSQRIKASEISSGLQYFGHSIDGGFDFTDDGLQDITVGALENVIVLRSRPVVRLLTSMRFNPERIPIFQNHSVVTAKLCFDTISALPVPQQVFSQSYILYTVDLDVKMPKTRVQFEDQNTTRSGTLPVSTHVCSELQLYTLPCDFDCFSSVFLRVKHKLYEKNYNTEFAVPVLDRYQPPETYFQLPYKDCNKTICTAQLTLTSQIQKEVVVGHTKEVIMKASLTNSGDDSYMTTMVLNYPKTLRFKKVTVEPSSPAIHCGQPIPLTAVVSSCNCRIGHPVFKKTTAKFSVIWQLDEGIFENKSAITVNITNINENSTILTEEHVLDVRYAVGAVLTTPVSLMYMNVSKGLTENKEFRFSVDGENRFNATINLQIWVPISIDGHTIITVKNASGTQEVTRCALSRDVISRDVVSRDVVSRDAVPGPRGPAGGAQTEGAGDVRYRGVRCDIRGHRDDITVSAEVSVTSSQQFLKSETVLLVPGQITFNRELYLDPNEENHRAEITLVFLKKEVLDPLPVIIGSCVGGLLLLTFIILLLRKCGFFERKYKIVMEQEDTS